MKNERRNSDLEGLVTKFLAGEASREEEVALQKWMDSDEINRRIFEEYRKVWEETGIIGHLSQIDLEKEWKRFEAAIESGERKLYTVPGSRGRSSLYVTFSRAAAVFLILMVTVIAAVYLTRSLGYQKGITQSEVKEILLPDDSKVTLNLYSTIRYPKRFNRRDRMVTLLGEAFFEVQHHSDKPFRVNTTSLIVEVMGTSFSVDAYAGKERIEVIVESGQVAVSKPERDSGKIILSAGDMAAYLRSDNTIRKTENRDANYLAWKTRIVHFTDDPLANVVKVLNEVYPEYTILLDEDISNCLLTATFDNQTLDAVLNVLKNTLDLEVVHEDDVIRISGDGC